MRRYDALLIVLLGLGGAFAAVIVLIAGQVEQLQPKLASGALSKIHLWLLLIAAQGALWAMSLLLVLRWWRSLLRWPRPSLADLLLGFAMPLVVTVVCTLVLILELTPPDWPPADLGGLPIGNLPIIGRFGVSVAALAVAGMIYAGLQARALCTAEASTDQRVAAYLELQRLLDGFLLLAALILGLGTLATAGLRDAYNAVAGSEANPQPFPQAYVVLYGGIYSLLLGITYAAARTGLLAAGLHLRQALVPAPPGQGSEIKAWSEQRRSVSALLRLGFSGLPALGEAFSVLAPLLVGAIAELL